MGQDNVVPRRINRVEGAVNQVMKSGGPGVVEFWGLMDYGLAFEGIVTSIAGAPAFNCSNLIGFGEEFFNGYWSYVTWDDGALGGAPQGEMLECTGYGSAAGLFTVAAYTVGIAVGDKVLLIHPAIAALINTTYGLSAIKTLIDAVEAKSEVLQYHDKIYYDEDTGIAGTAWPTGTPQVPSDVIADIITMCTARNIRAIQVHGALTLGATMEHYRFIGGRHEDLGDTVDLSGEDVDGSSFEGLMVIGVQAGAGFISIKDCIVNALTNFAGRINNSGIYVSMGFEDGTTADLDGCYSIHGVVTITVQAPTRASIKNWRGNLILTAQDGGVLFVRGYKGTLEIDAMTAGTLSIYADGADITINADCTGGTINIYGSANVTDNSVIGCTVNDYTEQDDRADKTAELIAADMSLVTSFGSGSLTNTGEATLCALDAISGTKKDVKVTVYLDAATVGNVEECWYLTSVAAPGTLVKKFPIMAGHNPGAAAVLTREFGDVPEGLQLQYRIDSGADDNTGVDYEVELAYLS